MEQIGDKIYKLRREKAFSQEELGFQIGVSRQTISKWEANSVQPNLENIKSLCEIFNVGIDFFLSDDLSTKSVNDEVSIATTGMVDIVEGKKHKKIYLVLSIVFGVITLALIFSIVMVGHSVFTPNTGAFQVKSTKMELPTFIILCVAFVISCALDVLFIIKHIRQRKM